MPTVRVNNARSTATQREEIKHIHISQETKQIPKKTCSKVINKYRRRMTTLRVGDYLTACGTIKKETRLQSTTSDVPISMET